MNTIRKILYSFLLVTVPAQAFWQAPQEIGIKMRAGATGYFASPAAQFDFAYRGYDGNKNEVDLQTLVFGKQNIEIQDVFLLGKLAKARKTSVVALDYVTLLSTSTIAMDLTQKRFRTAFEGSITGQAFKSDATFTLDVTIPLELYEHNIDARYYGDGIAGSVAAGDSTDPAYFFVRNDSVESYVKEEVLDPKGLTLLRTHRSFGLGAIRVAGVLDFQDCFEERVNKMQMGVVAHLNTPQVDSSSIIWPAVRGLGYHYVGLTGECEFDLAPVFAPFAQIEATKSFAHQHRMRIPKLMTGIGDSASYSSHGIIASKDMVGITITKNFSEYDTTVPYFADTANYFTRQLGSRIRLNVGNRVRLADVCMVEGWYSMYYKFADSISTCADTPAGLFNFATVTASTKNVSHSFGWKTSYNMNDHILATVGSQHVIKGKNTPTYSSFTASLEAAF